MAKASEVEGVLSGDGGPRHLDLKPWRVRDGEWQLTSLRVELPPRAGRAPTWKKGELVRVAVDKKRKAGPNAWMDFVAKGAPPVRRLPAAARAGIVTPPAPKAIVDRALGRLRPEEHFGWYSAWRTKNGAKYEVTIGVRDVSDRAACEVAVAKGSAAIVAVEKRRRELADAIAADLVPVYNKGWREDGAALTAAALKKALRITSIGVSYDGEVDVIFDCGDWFTDHGIEVRLSRSGKISEVGLA